MGNEKWGIVGIGKLGSGIVKQLGEQNQFIRFYHPDINKAQAFAARFPGHAAIDKAELAELDFLIVALPAQSVFPFVSDWMATGKDRGKTTWINMATAVDTEELVQTFPQMKWIGMKFMGHSEDLMLRGNGLFVTRRRPGLAREQEIAAQFFAKIGTVLFDDESRVEEVNRLATYWAIKAAKQLQQAMREKGYKEEWTRRALLSVAPEVMRSYVLGTLGHFGKQVAGELEDEPSAMSGEGGRSKVEGSQSGESA